MSFTEFFQPKVNTPMVPSVLPDAAKNQVLCGKLPILQMSNLFLKNQEYCHYADQALYEKRTVKQRKIRKSTGVSTPGLFRGTRVHFGGGETTSVDDVQYTSLKGVLYITNRRIIFTSSTEGFDKKVDDLISVNPYANCVEFQFGKETLKVFVPDGNLVLSVLKLINEASTFQK